MIRDKEIELPAGHVLCECSSERKLGAPAPATITVPAGQCACACFNEWCRRFGSVNEDAAKALFEAVALQAWEDSVTCRDTDAQADARLVLDAEHGPARRMREELAQAAGIDADVLRERARRRR